MDTELLPLAGGNLLIARTIRRYTGYRGRGDHAGHTQAC
jgi:hypothetical protein